MRVDQAFDLGLPQEVSVVPFTSRQQWKYAFATDQPWAHRWAHHTKTAYKKLPKRAKKKRKKGRN